MLNCFKLKIILIFLFIFKQYHIFIIHRLYYKRIDIINYFQPQMHQQLSKLPQEIRKLMPELKSQIINLDKINMDNAQHVSNCIKSKTIMDLLKPPEVHQPEILVTSKPIILVFCQPSEEIVIQRDKIYPFTPVSYANWLEAAGARCVPLPFNINEGSIQYLLQRSHGLLIPGGGSNLYKNFDMKEGQGPVIIGFLKIWRFIQKLWAKGVHFPIWGTCLGLQIMLLALSGEVKILSKLNSRGHQVQIYSHYENSWMLRKMPIKLRLKAENCKLLNFQHTYGISVKKFLSNAKLTQKLKVVQISKDKDGKWFCSGLQGKNLPIFLSQYHPEKQGFQWTRTGQIRHNRDSIELSQFLASSFLSQCRKCKAPKQFGSPTEQLFLLIQKYRQIHTPQKLYKVYAIDFKYREHDKQSRKQIKSQRSSSIASKIKPIF